MTVLRFPEKEHAFTDFVSGPTIVARRSVAREVPFPDTFVGEDTGFLKGVVAGGGTVYSADRFNFVQVRHSRGHTWQVSGAELLATGQVVAYADLTTHVMI